MACRASHGGQDRYAGAAGCARQDHAVFLYRLSRGDCRSAGGARRARLARAARQHHSLCLRRRQDDPGAEGLERARSQPAQRHSAFERVRRPRPLLDLPHPRRQRLQPAAEGLEARDVRARARRFELRSGDPARVPALPRPRYCFCAAVSGDLEDIAAQRGTADPRGPGALSGQHVRRHARLDQARRNAAAVRYGVHRQPLHQRGVAGGPRMRRHAQPVRRRRHSRAVRVVHRSAHRVPAGDPCGGADRHQCRRTESLPRARPARADPLRHRHQRGRSDRRRYRLSRSHVVHGAWRSGQCRLAARGPDQDTGMRGRDLRGGLSHRRFAGECAAVRRGTDPRSRRDDACAQGCQRARSRRAHR